MPLDQGSCHCGGVAFAVTTEPTEFTTYNCSLCRKKNAVMTKVHVSGLRLPCGEEHLGLYQWNTHVANHRFCTCCSIYAFHRNRVTPDVLGINVFCLDDADHGGIPVIAVDGVGMSVEPEPA